ncbi:hypothetical protein ANO11243_036790 [Dothideomycetidae sp. 11243]|nr:hypothetical protein ANO11243_036790 [fungal sp. No.11243]
MPRIARAARTFACGLPLRHTALGLRYESSIAVVGGGISGLGSAYFASKKYPEAKITVFESKSRFGGWLQSSRHTVPGDGGTVLFEAGPRTLRLAGNGRLTISMLEDLGLLDDVITVNRSSPSASNRYIYYPDHLVRIPGPPSPGWFTDLLHAAWNEEAFQGIIGAVLTEGFKRPRAEGVTDESIGSFLSRRMSPNLVNRLISAVFHGIYAGDVYQLSARSLLKTAYRNEATYGSLTNAAFAQATLQRRPPRSLNDQNFEAYLLSEALTSDSAKLKMKDASIFTFRNGIGQLTDSLIAHLKSNPNIKFNTNTSIESMSLLKDGSMELLTARGDQEATTSSHNRVIWTVPPGTLRSTTESRHAGRELPVVDSETVMTVNLYYKEPDMHPVGFGYLIPLATPIEQNPENALGVVFDSSYSPDPRETSSSVMPVPLQDETRERGTKLTVILGGHFWNDWKSYPSEKEGLEMGKEVVKRHMGIMKDPLVSSVNLQANCIPRYAVGHHNKLSQTHEWLMKRFSGRVKVAGSWIDGVGVNDCLRSAWNAVNCIEDLDSTSLNSVIFDDDFMDMRPKKSQD